jgi:GxxExxY protein
VTFAVNPFPRPPGFASLRPCVFALKTAQTGMNENELSKIIVDSAIEVHRELGGPGLIESVYEESMAEELTQRGLRVGRPLQVPIFYKGKRLGNPLRLDLKINELVLVDNMAAAQWNPIFEAQMLTYLRLTGLKLGLVINFGEQFVKNGIRRVVNGL